MIRLKLPAFEARVERHRDKIYIWDVLRRKFVRLTPEEWVRQHFVHYLIDVLGYPSALLMNEVAISVGKCSKRVDSILYNRQLQPTMLIEYKAPDIMLNERVLRQALQYNYALHVPYLILSNGLEHVAYKIDYEEQSYQVLSEIPHYTAL